MIRFATKDDYPALISMWHACFGDDFRALRFLFGRLQRPERMLVLEQDGKPAATLSVRDFDLRSAGGSAKAAYIYGVATLPEHQGKGYATRLMEHAHGVLGSRGYACSVLVPAGKSLFDFYGGRGYETLFRLNLAEVTMAGAERMLGLEPVSAERLEALRDSWYGDSRPFARWDRDYLSFIVEESRFNDGDTFGFTFGGADCCAVCSCRGKTLHVKELCAPADAVEPLVRTLSEMFQRNRIVLYLREDVQTSYTNNLLPFGMVQWYDSNVKSALCLGGGAPAYIAHVLD